MPDDRRKLRERLLAAATFAAIGLATLGALDFLVTGGFDPGARRTASTYGSPLIGASVPLSDAEQPAPTVTAVTWIDPEAVDEVEQTDETLLDAAAEPGEAVAAPSEDRLNQEIAELYLEDARENEDEAEDAAPTESALSDGNDIFYDPLDLLPDPNAPDSE